MRASLFVFWKFSRSFCMGISGSTTFCGRTRKAIAFRGRISSTGTPLLLRKWPYKFDGRASLTSKRGGSLFFDKSLETWDRISGHCHLSFGLAGIRRKYWLKAGTDGFLPASNSCRGVRVSSPDVNKQERLQFLHHLRRSQIENLP